MTKKESPKTILLVDDDPGFREILSTKLKVAGFAVEAVANGEAGIEKAQEIKPSLILLDMQMPKMSGADTLLKLKETKETKDINVVFLTSYGDEKMLEQEKMLYNQMGALDYLKKTDDLDVLISKVKSYLS